MLQGLVQQTGHTVIIDTIIIIIIIEILVIVIKVLVRDMDLIPSHI